MAINLELDELQVLGPVEWGGGAEIPQSDDVARRDAANTFAQAQSFSSAVTCGDSFTVTGAFEVTGAGEVGFFGAVAVTQQASLTAPDGATVDGTYGTEEAGVITNLRTRVNELESRLQAYGLLP